MDQEDIRVLIIDDEEIISSTLKDYLEDFNFSIDTADTGEGGLLCLQSAKFDAAIVDLRLPDMDGNDFILKSSRIQPDIEFFIHTGSIDYVIPPELIELGLSADSIIHKPVLDMDTIRDAILKRLE